MSTDEYTTITSDNMGDDNATSSISSAEQELYTTTWIPDDGITNSTIFTSTSSNNFTWNFTITPPPTVIITSNVGYYYLYSFYCFMCLLFLMSLIGIIVRLSVHQKKAVQQNRRQGNLATVNYNTGNGGYNNCNATATTVAMGATTSRAAQSNNENNDFDLPPQYDDIWNILDAKMDLNALEEGAVGGSMAPATSTSTMETVLDLGAGPSGVTQSQNNNSVNYPIV